MALAVRYLRHGSTIPGLQLFYQPIKPSENMFGNVLELVGSCCTMIDVTDDDCAICPPFLVVKQMPMFLEKQCSRKLDLTCDQFISGYFHLTIKVKAT